MATKKTETKTETKAVNEEKKVVDDGMVDLFIPIDYNNPDDDTFYCSVNGSAMLIPKGETVRVPAQYAAAYKLVEEEQKIQMARAKQAKAADYQANQQYINSTT